MKIAGQLQFTYKITATRTATTTTHSIELCRCHRGRRHGRGRGNLFHNKTIMFELVELDLATTQMSELKQNN